MRESVRGLYAGQDPQPSEQEITEATYNFIDFTKTLVQIKRRLASESENGKNND